MSRKLTIIKRNKQRRRKMFFRRVLTTTFVVAIFGLIGFFIYADRIERLVDARERYENYRDEYEEMLALQQFFESEISKLQNEDFLAMLARQRYFKSLPGEILFRIPEDSEQINEN